MELPDCPPGAEGYQDSVTEIAKKPEHEETIATCTKAEQEFQQHLNSLKIRTEDGSYRCMVERRGRDISGMWIYLCYPCAAMCSGENVLQTHISGKKHKNKLSMRSLWPLSIFEEHPYIQSEKGVSKNKAEQAYDKVLQKMAKEVENFTTTKSELDLKYDKYREIRCHIQDTLDVVKAPLIGVEYLIEHPPEQAHYEPSYMCVLCIKQGHPRTIVNHLTCFWHRYNYLVRHFNKACTLIAPYRTQNKYREGVIVIIKRLAARIQDTYGRMRPVNIDKEEYEKDRDQIHQWIFKGHHFSEHDNYTFEEVVDADLINSLDSSKVKKNVDSSPPVSAASFKPYSKPHHQGVKRNSMDSLSDISDETDPRYNRPSRGKPDQKRFAPYPEKRREEAPHQSSSSKTQNPRPHNYEYKLKLAKDQRASAEELSRKALAYYEKNPEKHPLYPEEWKKFWNRRYKEIQIEGKDPSKHDFKPEWILFWTTRMKELHEEELRSSIAEIYRRLRLTPPETKEPEMTEKWNEQEKSQDRYRSAERRRSPQKRRSPPPRRRSPEPRRRSSPTQPRRRSPDYRAVNRRSSPLRRSSPPRRSSAARRSPQLPLRRSPLPRRSSPLRRESPRRRSPPLRSLRTRSRSPMKLKSLPGRKTAGSPLSCRESMPRNQSPRTLQDTVLISDDELKADDLSPWNSDDTLGSLPDTRSPARRRSRTGSVASRTSRMNRSDKYREVAAPQDFGAAENVVATLRLLVALEDYLGSLGPKIVDLLAEALKMEKDKANSSEDLLELETAVVLIETAKEKLKGAIQAGLVSSAAAAAVRTAIVRAASTLHEADIRMKKKKQRQAQMKPEVKERGPVPVAGVGAVDREQIAQQMAAALIAQGKTDVSSEELAQLVEAVVGMAEAKKREAQAKNKTEARAANDKSTRAFGTASALQMLQSAYDDKRVEKEDVPDAMDGLSDSDLETLLKNFNELSAEEQHSLIAYLKKLEAREPERVERLRKYVSAAANSTPTPAEEKPPSKGDSQLVTIESDDDDYTVEDVFKSATQKVKEDQIRQEMEIVKKSIEESKEPPLETLATSAGSEVQKGSFSATDLLALVQASLQSTAAPTLTSTTVISDVVTSNTQPRSFGDLPASTLSETLSNMQNPILTSNNQFPTQQTSARNIQNIMDVGREGETNESTNTAWESLQVRSSMDTQQNMANQEHGGHQDNFNRIPRAPQENYNQSPLDNNNMNSGFQGNFNQGPQRSYNQRPQGSNLGLQGNYNQQGYNDNLQSNFNQGLQENYNQGQQNNYNHETWEQQACNNQGPQDNYNLVSRGQQNNYNPETLDKYDHDSQDSQNDQDYNLESQDSFNRTPLLPFNEGLRGSQGNFNQGPRPQNFNQGQRGPQNYNQPPSLLNNNYNQDQSFRMRGFFNQGRGNFSGNRNQDNFKRSDGNPQQYGYQKQNNFRGRGFGGQRGRGRGYY